ncbi:hypothetical protein JQR88_24145 (plasmid) [Pseudomonas luteola]|uniref:DUF7079 family protein n=1 Tax=Pseudomonas luteola TaxID=47886 RepID=UPI003D9FDF7D
MSGEQVKRTQGLNSLCLEDRRPVWAALSGAFVDNEVDYQQIAKAIQPYDLDVVKELFFSKVAPVCYRNSGGPVPAVWTAFDSAWLETRIETLTAARHGSLIKRLKATLLIACSRHVFKDEWRRIESARAAL